MRVAELLAVAATLTLFAFVVATPRQQDVQIGVTASAGDVQLVDDTGDAPDTDTTDADDDDSAMLEQEEEDEQNRQQEQQDLQNMLQSEQEAEQQNEAAQQQVQLDEQLASQ